MVQSQCCCSRSIYNFCSVLASLFMQCFATQFLQFCVGYFCSILYNNSAVFPDFCRGAKVDSGVVLSLWFLCISGLNQSCIKTLGIGQ